LMETGHQFNSNLNEWIFLVITLLFNE
jgi:hypothetical protein